jgi:hypothetical protein
MDSDNYTPEQIIEEINRDLQEAIKDQEAICLNEKATDAEKQTAIRNLQCLKPILEAGQNINLPISKLDQITPGQMMEAQKVTCFGNLMYCCGLEKSCYKRDLARAALHMNDELYKSKENALLDLVKFTKVEGKPRLVLIKEEIKTIE